MGLGSRARCFGVAEMPLFLSRMCVKRHFGFYSIWQANTHCPLEEKRQPVLRIKELWDPTEPVQKNVAIKEVVMYQFIRYEQQTQM